MAATLVARLAFGLTVTGHERMNDLIKLWK
jgi:hypothetical protein